MRTLGIYIACYSLLATAACGRTIARDDTRHNEADPLPSWNESLVKQSIIKYVQAVTDSGSKDFIPAIDRMATFDNDGTLWAEQPLVQELFAFHQVKKMAEKKPIVDSR